MNAVQPKSPDAVMQASSSHTLLWALSSSKLNPHSSLYFISTFVSTFSISTFSFSTPLYTPFSISIYLLDLSSLSSSYINIPDFPNITLLINTLPYVANLFSNLSTFSSPSLSLASCFPPSVLSHLTSSTPTPLHCNSHRRFKKRISIMPRTLTSKYRVLIFFYTHSSSSSTRAGTAAAWSSRWGEEDDAVGVQTC